MFADIASQDREMYSRGLQQNYEVQHLVTLIQAVDSPKNIKVLIAANVLR